MTDRLFGLLEVACPVERAQLVWTPDKSLVAEWFIVERENEALSLPAGTYLLHKKFDDEDSWEIAFRGNEPGSGFAIPMDRYARVGDEP